MSRTTRLTIRVVTLTGCPRLIILKAESRTGKFETPRDHKTKLQLEYFWIFSKAIIRFDESKPLQFLFYKKPNTYLIQDFID